MQFTSHHQFAQLVAGVEATLSASWFWRTRDDRHIIWGTTWWHNQNVCIQALIHRWIHAHLDTRTHMHTRIYVYTRMIRGDREIHDKSCSWKYYTIMIQLQCSCWRVVSMFLLTLGRCFVRRRWTASMWRAENPISQHQRPMVRICICPMLKGLNITPKGPQIYSNIFFEIDV